MSYKGENMANTKSNTSAKNLAKKELKKQAKKNPLVVLLLVVFLAVGALGGFFGAKLITQHDTFQLVGQQELTLKVGEQYKEEGVKIISFGRDISSQAKSESTVDTSVAGKYYVKYTVDDLRFKGVVRYRYITVVEESA